MCENKRMKKLSMPIATATLLSMSVFAANPFDGGRQSIRVGQSESELVRQLGVPQRKIAVEDSAGKVVGKYLYYTVETGSIRFYIEDERIQEISNVRERD